MDISAYQHMNIRMSTRGKRPLRNLTPSDKIRAIQRIHNGETKASVSRDIGVPESTLRGWCKNEQKLRFMCRQLGTADQITAMSGIENPPEKRPRFDNLIQTPKYSANVSFDEFGYSRLPLSGLSFTSNGSNDILEKIALNEIMKKHIMPGNSSAKPSIDIISNQMTGIVGGPIPLGGDYSTPLSMMQNLNLLSLLGPNLTTMSNFNASSSGAIDTIKNKNPLRVVDDSLKFVNSDNGTSSNNKTTNNSNINNINNNNNNNNNNNINVNNTAALFVKNWARDPGEKASLYVTAHNNSHIITTATLNDSNTNSNSNNNTNINNNNNNNNSNGIANNRSVNDTNNNNIEDKCSTFHVEAPTHVANFPSPIPLRLLQIPNSNNVIDSENSNTAFLEWCRVFNASLNFLALAAAAAALHPNDAINVTNVIKKDDNILYKELTRTAHNFDSVTNPLSIINSDISSDSYVDSEPEDLSVRSTVTSKLSSPANSRSQSPIKSNGSCSSIHSEGEH